MENIFQFIRALFALPSFATWVAFSALCISLLSLIWTKKAAHTSELALAHAQSESAKSDQLKLEETRLELLRELIAERSKLEALRVDLGAAKASHDADPSKVKLLLQNYSQIFDGLPQIEYLVSQLEQNHARARQLNPSNGSTGFLQLRADHNKVSSDVELFIKCTRDSLPTFLEKRELAIKEHRNSVRGGGDA